MEEQDTVWPLDPHTRVKHDIYDGYLDAWWPIIMQSFGAGTYAEGFAGPGIYTGREPGSPVRALRRLQAMRAAKPHLVHRPARFVFVEKRPDRVRELLAQLREELADPITDGEYRDASLHVLVKQGTCEQTLPALLHQVGAKGAPLLGVLDSFGGGSTSDLVARFARQKAGEVLVTVEPQHFVRNLNPSRADRVFGGPRWREVDQYPAAEKRAFIARTLDDAVREAGFRYVIAFGLETAKGNELLLQFATNHPLGLERFKDSLWRADPISGARFRDPNDPEQGLLDFTPDHSVAPLRRRIHEHLQTRPDGSATYGELREFVFERTFYRKPDAGPALNELLDRGLAVTSSRQPRIAPGTPASTRITVTDTEQYRLA